MNAMFSPDQFPSRQSMQRGFWAPVLFAPNPDTADRLVIAVVAVNAGRRGEEALMSIRFGSGDGTYGAAGYGKGSKTGPRNPRFGGDRRRQPFILGGVDR
jgi:hypothetical protein